MSYFIITSGEDGISIEGPLTENDVHKWVSERVEYAGSHPEFVDCIPDQDKGYFWSSRGISENVTVLIKGEVIVPKPVKVVTEYTL